MIKVIKNKENKEYKKMKKNNKSNWQVISSSKVHSGVIFDTYQDQISINDRAKKEWSYIKVQPGVCILPIDVRDNIYLVKEYRYPIKSYNFGLIGGGIEKQETPLEAAKRELKEEAGIVAKDFIDLGKMTIAPSCEEHYNTHFLARDLSFTENDLESDEDIQLFSIPLLEAIKWVEENKIVDVEAVSLIYRAKSFLDKNNR